MVEIGLWIQMKTDNGEEVFLMKKDPSGHPVLSVVKYKDSLDTNEDKKLKLRELYEQLTGHPHPHGHATSRQLMWDFLEAALKYLP